MKKIKLLFLSLLLVFSLASCDENTPTFAEETHTITYTSLGHVLYEFEVEKGDFLVEPLDPTREGYEFIGWYFNGEKWDFTNPAKGDMILVAKYQAIEEPTPEEPTPEEPTPEITPTPDVEPLMEYYSLMEGHFDSTFKATLHSIIKNHTKLSYSQVWTALSSIDEADSTNIRCLYTDMLIPKSERDQGTTSPTPIWNREHSWPNSHGFSSKDYAAYTDLHHLFASEKSINATRGNKDWGNVSSGSSDSYGNKWNSSYFEIRDEMKGDIARAMFYLVVRYDDPSELDLELVDGTTSTSSNKTGKLGSLSVLLEWHEQDPVSQREIDRNNAIYEWQGNRNPFVDYPEWVDFLYPTV